jgi:ribosomal protein S18 acetylase RimI-like enzyme
VVSIRPAQPEDAAAVAAVHVRSWQVGYRGLLPDEYLSNLRPAERMARYTFGSTDPRVPATIVAIEGGAICGFATIGADRGGTPNVGELLALYVDPHAWGRGIGQRLIVEARLELVARAFDEALLWVLAGNDRAERFYRADGWLPDGLRRTVEVWGVLADESRYRRRL